MMSNSVKNDAGVPSPRGPQAAPLHPLVLIWSSMPPPFLLSPSSSFSSSRFYFYTLLGHSIRIILTRPAHHILSTPVM